MDKQKLGQELLKTKKLTKEQWQMVLTLHDKIGGDFAPLLVKLGYVSDIDITEIIGRLEGVETIDISTIVIPKKLMNQIPRDVIEKHGVIPISRRENQITLAMSNINEYDAIEEIQFLTGCKVEPVLASREGIRKAIFQFFSEEQKEEEPTTPSKDATSLEKLIEQDNLAFQKALVQLLIQKNIFSQDELLAKLGKSTTKEEKK